MLKPSFTSYILHLLEYIETHARLYFIIILEWVCEFFHIFWIINFEFIETTIQMLHIALISIY
jgi:hypothetical protein